MNVKDVIDYRALKNNSHINIVSTQCEIRHFDQHYREITSFLIDNFDASTERSHLQYASISGTFRVSMQKPISF